MEEETKDRNKLSRNNKKRFCSVRDTAKDFIKRLRGLPVKVIPNHNSHSNCHHEIADDEAYKNHLLFLDSFRKFVYHIKDTGKQNKVTKQ
jgi:hypothetical protein